jgi:hypothetical protein
MGFIVGVGLSRFLLGRVAVAEGNLDEAKDVMNRAILDFKSVGAEFELRRATAALSKIAKNTETTR